MRHQARRVETGMMLGRNSAVCNHRSCGWACGNRSAIPAAVASSLGKPKPGFPGFPSPDRHFRSVAAIVCFIPFFCLSAARGSDGISCPSRRCGPTGLPHNAAEGFIPAATVYIGARLGRGCCTLRLMANPQQLALLRKGAECLESMAEWDSNIATGPHLGETPQCEPRRGKPYRGEL